MLLKQNPLWESKKEKNSPVVVAHLFKDNSFYEILTGKERGKLQRRTACREDCLQLFQDYSRKTDTRY